MNNTVKRLVRLVAFGLALLVLIVLANTFCLRTDAITVMTLREMYDSDDIDIAFIGSSVVREHINPEIITEKTGLKAFNVAFLSASLQGDIAVTQELFAHHDPKYTVLVIEPYTLDTAKENPETQYMLMPHLRSLRTKLEYYMRLVPEDGFYVDRALMFRRYYPTSWADFMKTVGMRLNPEKTFAKVAEQMKDELVYMGAGFERIVSGTSAEQTIRREMARMPDPGYMYELLEPTKEMLLEYKAMCEQEGTQLVIVCFPNHTSHVLAEPEYLPYARSLMNFCAKNGITCFNLSLAKPSIMPNFDAYYADLYHLSGEGADLFSAAFGEFFARYMAGENLEDEFYWSEDDMRAAVDFITNTWLFPDEENPGAFTADCNTGSLVVPEYRFELIDAAGNVTPVRDYSADPHISCEIPEGSDLRVWARPQGGEQQAHVYYDYPTDYDAFYGDDE